MQKIIPFKIANYTKLTKDLWKINKKWSSFVSGSKIPTSEYYEYGGARFVTFMVYLSDVPLGGHTVFPQPGSSVQYTGYPVTVNPVHRTLYMFGIWDARYANMSGIRNHFDFDSYTRQIVRYMIHDSIYCKFIYIAKFTIFWLILIPYILSGKRVKSILSSVGMSCPVCEI